MESFDAMGLCIGRDADDIARALKLEAITLRKWKQDPVDGSGSRNPLDVIRILISSALNLDRDPKEALAPLFYLQECFRDQLKEHPEDVHEAYSDTMHEFSRLVSEHTAALRDGKVSPAELRRMDRIIFSLRTKLDEYESALNAEAGR
jgi:hypothetical protein